MTFENGKQGDQLDWAFNCSSNDDKDHVCKQSRPENIWRCGNVYSIPPNEREPSASLQRVPGQTFERQQTKSWTKFIWKHFNSGADRIQICRSKIEAQSFDQPNVVAFQQNAKETRSAVLPAGRQFQIDISVMPSNLTCTLTPIQSGDESAAPNIRRVNKFQRLIAWPITTTHHPLLPSFNNLKISCPPNTILSFNHSSQSTF